MFSLPNNATIIEVGPRDGLQNEGNLVSTENKLEFITALQNAGIQEMELTSFVSPKWVPQMADAKEIVAQTKKVGRQFVLTPNERGVTAALESGATSLAVFVGVSNTFNKKNINKTTAESMAALQPLIYDLKKQGIFVRACISTAFYCPFEGAIAPEATLSLCRQFVEWGVDELSVADTIGMATPKESYALFTQLVEAFPNVLMTAHFHDTRRMALANITAALQAGVTRFDSSAGGLGGCPFAPGATGNVATEDVVNMLHQMAIHTGIDLDLLCKAIEKIEPHVTNPVTTGMYTLYKNKG
ncbi:MULTISPECIES: hydroxymethylglutaryl-CoA lyase [Planococcus]|uniref:Hydroxymethylglutaryl-CoA lyase n=1 Tax=Planococcus faecalis TaxID=1598147 RepID=A0ABM6ISX1_9BACL|nr:MULTISPECIES: hydroxymethylglutaryl-CoA lyase [Planococcus]AQU79683.1 hydroxymethylglutaryl-CoA lyase [Planococcus faecalis]MDJ0331713.1 hydroxymethylglutaryl-CoA lyase [Planococcus sp. S3-L1]